MSTQQNTHSSWIDKLKSAKKAGLLQNGTFYFHFISIISGILDRKKVHYTFDDQTEMVEEYDAKSNVLLSMSKSIHSIELIYFLIDLVRKWRQKPTSGLKTAATSDAWIFEIGQNYETRPVADNTLGMTESTATVSQICEEIGLFPLVFTANLLTK